MMWPLHQIIHETLSIFFRFSICMRQNGFSPILIQDNPNGKFTMETENSKVILFLDVLIDNRNNILNITTYHKWTYSGLLLNFDSFTSCF